MNPIRSLLERLGRRVTIRWRRSWPYLGLALLAACLLAGCGQRATTPAATAGAITATETPLPTADAVAMSDEGSAVTPEPAGTPESAGATPDMPRFEPGECRFRRPAWPDVECGDLLVPENRDQEEGPIIRLHVAILRSKAEQPEPDPNSRYCWH